MKRFRVTEQGAGIRLDKYLVMKSPNFSRQLIKDLIDSGRVRVNGRRVVIAKWAMKEGDSVEINLDGFEVKRTEEKRAVGRPGQKKMMPTEKMYGEGRSKPFINVVYEDRDVMVVEKPAGVVIQSGGTRFDEKTYVDDLKAYLKRKHNSKGAFVMPVHRLDKDTTGLMVFAVSRVGERLTQQFKKHSVERCYLALVDGAVEADSGRVDLPIKKGDFGHGKKASIGRKGDGSRALSLYLVVERYAAATLLRLDLKSGITHQARVHMAAINHPIVGDRIYGRSGAVTLDRQALHSHILGFRHPATGRKMRFRSELPRDMQRLVERLRG